jgi:hypothetical protein
MNMIWGFYVLFCVLHVPCCEGWIGLEAFYDSGSRSVYLLGGCTDLDTTQGAKINN